MKEDDNIYILEEEQDPDQSPMNFAAYGDEERLKEEQEEKGTNTRKTSFGLLMKIMFNPVEGWKSLRRSNISLEGLQAGCFYPLLALLSISEFADYFYSVNIGLSQIMTKAVVIFVSFFFGFYCIQMVLSLLLPKDMAEKYEGRFGKEYSVVALSTLALFSIITNLLPMLWPILIFLPIWTLYIMFKGARFFKFEEKQEMKFFVLAAISAIGIPLLIEWGLTELLPY